MKKLIVFIPLFLLFSVLFFSCEKEEANVGNLSVHLVYKLNESFPSAASVSLYSSQADLDAGTNQVKTASSNPSTGIAYFENLPVGTYFVKASGVAGGFYYEGQASTYVSMGGTKDMELPLLPDGDLAVVVKQGSVSGYLIGGALVNLYKSEADRTAGTLFRSAMSSTTNPQDGAIFYSLHYQHYYVNVNYSNAQGEWIGIGDALVPRGMQTVIYVICVQ